MEQDGNNLYYQEDYSPKEFLLNPIFATYSATLVWIRTKSLLEKGQRRLFGALYAAKRSAFNYFTYGAVRRPYKILVQYKKIQEMEFMIHRVLRVFLLPYPIGAEFEEGQSVD